MKIQAARGSQKRAIAAFCRSQDPDDYIPAWIGRFLAQGTFFVLKDGEKIVGLVHGQRAPDGSAWMSAARVHADYRGQGWMNRLNDFALASPALHRAHAARMLITSTNTSSIRAATKGGFRVVSRLSFVDWEGGAKSRGAPRLASGFSRGPAASFRRRALHSPVLRAQRGLAYAPFTGAFELNARALRVLRNWLYDSPRAGPIAASMFADTGERWMGVQAFHATAEAANGIIAFAREQRAESMTVILPEGERFARPFLKAGYTRSEWAKHVLIFERRLSAAKRGATSSASRGAGARRPTSR